MSSALPIVVGDVGNRAGGAWMDFGDNRWGCRLSSDGDYTGVIASTASVIGDGSSVLCAVECRSTLEFTRNGFEGLGVWVFALDSQANTVWHNELIAVGNTNNWAEFLPGDWARIYIPINIPRQFRTPFLACALVVKGTNGHVDIDTASFKTQYAQVFPYNEPAEHYFDFDRQIEPSLGFGLFGNEEKWIRYLSTAQISIPRGQSFTVSWRAEIDLVSGRDAGGNELFIYFYTGIKVTYNDGTSAFFGQSHSFNSNQGLQNIDWDRTQNVTASKPIVQIERIIAIWADQTRNNTTMASAQLRQSGIASKIISLDQIEAGGEA